MPWALPSILIFTAFKMPQAALTHRGGGFRLAVPLGRDAQKPAAQFGRVKLIGTGGDNHPAKFYFPVSVSRTEQARKGLGLLAFFGFSGAGLYGLLLKALLGFELCQPPGDVLDFLG
jgi:hypothetical protein